MALGGRWGRAEGGEAETETEVETPAESEASGAAEPVEAQVIEPSENDPWQD